MKKITLLFAVLLTAITLSAQTQLASPTIGSPTVATSSGFTSNWTVVSNALSYNVKIYLNGTTTLVTNKVVYGQATATLAISGLTGSTAYQCTVTALGDGVTYSNSPESSFSTSITTLSPTLATSAPTANAATAITSTGFTANWSLASAATSYTITVYDASSNIVFYTPNLGNSVVTGVVTGLNAGTNYTYTVTAAGDASTTATSASVAVTTLAASALTTPTGLAATAANLKATYFTPTWTAVTGAVSYDVRVYSGSTLISTKNSLTNSILIAGLTPSTAYTFTVTAKANPLTNLNSAEATAVAFTTNASGSLATPSITVGATRVGTYGFTANWDAAIASATGYVVKVYQGVTNVYTVYVPGASVIKSVIGANLLPNTAYTYTVSAVAATTPNFESAESAPSPSFTTQNTGYAMQYADSVGLKNEMKFGVADIYELTTSGYNYVLTPSTSATGLVVNRGFTLRGQTGLASKPIFSYSNSSTSSSQTVFSTTTPGLSFAFDNLELNGTNANTSGSQAILLTATNTTTWANVEIKNCKIYNFLNASSSAGGNGMLRLEGPSSVDGTNKTTVSLSNSTFDNCAGRIITLYTASLSSYQRYGLVSLDNCTFSNITGTTGNPNTIVIYRSATQKALGTSLSINHCTFYGYNSSNNIFTIQNASPGGPTTMSSPIAIKNCVFDTGSPAYALTYTSSTGNTTVFDNCWTSNFSTPLVPAVNALYITNPFSASPVPAYTNVATKNFSLTNLSSFICTDGYVAGNRYGVSLSALAAPVTINDASGITSTSFNASWSAVSGATGYLVNVYNGTNLVTSLRVASESATINDLASNTIYTYKVIAIGDAVNFSSSGESVASNAFSTSIGTNINKPNVKFNITVSGNTILASESGNFEIFNLQGIRLLEVSNVNYIETNLLNGLYVVRFTNNAGKQNVQKIIIK